MKQFLLSIKSKNYKSLKAFFNLLIDKLKRFRRTKFLIYNKKNKHFFSILKSPHVNKKAQDQFQFVEYFKNVNMYIDDYKRVFIYIKNLIFKTFTDVYLKIRIIINKNITNFTHLQIFNPNNFKLNLFNKIKTNKSLNLPHKNKSH